MSRVRLGSPNGLVRASRRLRPPGGESARGRLRVPTPIPATAPEEQPTKDEHNDRAPGGRQLPAGLAALLGSRLTCHRACCRRHDVHGMRFHCAGHPPSRLAAAMRRMMSVLPFVHVAGSRRARGGQKLQLAAGKEVC